MKVGKHTAFLIYVIEHFSAMEHEDKRLARKFANTVAQIYYGDHQSAASACKYLQHCPSEIWRQKSRFYCRYARPDI